MLCVTHASDSVVSVNPTEFIWLEAHINIQSWDVDDSADERQQTLLLYLQG